MSEADGGDGGHRRRINLVFGVITLHGDGGVFQIAFHLRVSRPRAIGNELRHRDDRKKADDTDHHEEFDETKAASRLESF